MKKYLAMLCATMLCVCCLALAACGGSSSSSAAASGSASASASASASSSAAQATFVGDWKLAAIEYENIMMSGDFDAMFGDGMNMTLSIKEGGTGTMGFGGDTTNIKWTEKGADAISITPEATSENPNPQTFDATLKDGALSMLMEQDSFSGTVFFTKDGTYAGATAISVDNAKPITSEDALVGTWNLIGMNMLGINMFGSGEDLSAMAGGTDTAITFEKGGKVTFMGESTTYTVGADGAAIAEGDLSVPIKALDNNILIDMSDLLGMQMVMVFSK
jgi:hypothetical protein